MGIDMTVAIQTLLNGLVLGMIYVLVASGLTIVLGICRIINFAHGEFYMLGGFGIYWLSTVFGLNYFLSLVISLLALGFLGRVVERYFFRRVRGQFLPSVGIAVGVMFFMSAAALLAFGERDRAVEAVFHGSVRFMGVTLTTERLMVIMISIAVMLGLWYFIKQTKAGQAMRAVSQDVEAAALQGINANSIYSLSMFLGCALAAVAGGIIAPVFYVNAFLGGAAVFKAFLVIIVGGVGTIPGAVLAGLLLGLVEAIGFGYIGGWTELTGFVVVLLLLMFRPGGLVGRVWEL